MTSNQKAFPLVFENDCKLQMPDETKITGKACEQDDRGDGKDGGKKKGVRGKG